MNRSETKPKKFKKFLDSIINYVERKTQKQEFVDPRSSIYSLLGEKRHVPTKILSSADTYLQYDNNGDTNFKALSAEEHFTELKTHFIDII